MGLGVMTDSSDPAPLRSVHTSNFPLILQQLRSSLVVTTYQAGKVVLLRDDGGVLNTHFRNFNKPMGLAVHRNRLAIGGAYDIWEFHNVPAACEKLQPPGKHDACYLPRKGSITGDVQIHEMAWVDEELWFVNTAFSCLATRSDSDSFTPRWRPSFVSRLMPGDCCHINGLAVRDGKVRYVSALGRSDTPGGWRANKRDGGVVIDVAANQILCDGLAMPHSPRWDGERLWLLESGQGGVGYVDPATGRYRAVCQLPGFTRGMCLHGGLAFVGLSQVRESATFGDIPLVERLESRICGIWVIDLRTGEVIAFCQFEDAVQEIFAVELLQGKRYPDLINDDASIIANTYVLNDNALADVPDELRRDEGGVRS